MSNHDTVAMGFKPPCCAGILDCLQTGNPSICFFSLLYWTTTDAHSLLEGSKVHFPSLLTDLEWHLMC